ncbi:YqgE/AlgH family protein [Laribacter hongkongensis]|uniref:YqgE/AlgH family protein n=1 Tax=Laribacter hongkongensis TaxID=168471 RepID=UPI001EFE82F6|nr:YqgE/AlgH family protein [Laribacter hongkongensis]MCG9115748.1 YqgE/AlgH family protein [Laribacter hongkongensis]
MDTLCLSHHFLIAMPDMEDSLFARAVVYMCDHGEQGAMGVIINHGADLTLDSLLGQIGLDGCRPDQVGLPVFVGGPVQSDRGFVLHEPIGNWQSSLTVTDNVALTTSRDVLAAVSHHEGPERLIVTLGYAGWEPGQLEHELVQNAWLTVPADMRIVFDLPVADRYDAAIRLLGIEPSALFGSAGHA